MGIFYERKIVEKLNMKMKKSGDITWGEGGVTSQEKLVTSFIGTYLEISLLYNTDTYE